MCTDKRVRMLQTHLGQLFEQVAAHNITGWNKVIFDSNTGMPRFEDIDVLTKQLCQLLPKLATKKIYVQNNRHTLCGALNPIETIRTRIISNNPTIHILDIQKSHIHLDANRLVKSICMLYEVPHNLDTLDVDLSQIRKYFKAAQKIHAPVYKIAASLYQVYTRHLWLKSLAPQVTNNDGSEKHISYLLGNYLKYICCFSLINSWCQKQKSKYTNIRIDAVPCRANNKDIYQLKLLAIPNDNTNSNLSELIICTEFGISLRKSKNNTLLITSDDLNKEIDYWDTNFFKNLVACMDFEQEQFDSSSDTMFKRDFYIDILLKGPNNTFVVIEVKFRTDALSIVDALSQAIRTQNYEYTQCLKELYASDSTPPKVSNYIMSSYSNNSIDINNQSIYTGCIQANGEPNTKYLSSIAAFTDKILDNFNTNS